MLVIARTRESRNALDYNRKETQTEVVIWTCLPSIRSGQNHLCKAQLKGEEDEADRRRGEKTASGNGQVWSSPSSKEQCRTEKNGGN